MQTLRALIVDDSENDFRLMVGLLEADGLEVEALRVDTGEELAGALEREWDIVLCDDAMPALDSREAYRMVSEAKAPIPFVIVSGAIGYDLALQAMRDGVRDFVDKRDLPRLAPVVMRETGLSGARRAGTLDHFAENCPLGVVVLSERRIRFCNDRFAQLMEADAAAQLIGRAMDELLPAPDPLVRAWIDGNADALHGRPVFTTALTLRGQSITLEIAGGRIADGPVRSVAFFNEVVAQEVAPDAGRNADSRGVEEYIQRFCSDDRPKALFFLDIDCFRHINGLYGYREGDRLLDAIEARIADQAGGVRPIRLGGDGFLFMEVLERPEAAEQAAQAYRTALREPFLVGEQPIGLTFSIGIALFPEHGDSGEALLGQAGLALRAAKKAGRNQIVFSGEPSAHIQQKGIHLLEGLRRAVDGQEFFLQYQPQVDTHSGAVIGAEALLRWRHPQLGLVSPAEFIPLAEESGEIVRIGGWVLREACFQARRWHDAGFHRVTMGVNLSAHQLYEPDLIGEVAQAVEDAGIPPSALELELTESALVVDPARAAHAMSELRSLGVRLAMDDFGTGYSSLSYLKRFPLDTLKVDRMFVQDMDDGHRHSVIAAAIINLGRDLDLRVIAEGVETRQQLKAVHEMGCRCVQGFLFSKPADAEVVQEMLRKRFTTSAA